MLNQIKDFLYDNAILVCTSIVLFFALILIVCLIKNSRKDSKRLCNIHRVLLESVQKERDHYKK
jgi:hypothetical protein